MTLKVNVKPAAILRGLIGLSPPISIAPSNKQKQFREDERQLRWSRRVSYNFDAYFVIVSYVVVS